MKYDFTTIFDNFITRYTHWVIEETKKEVRLEKIKKLTGLDLREFEDAIIFKVALMVEKYVDYKHSGISSPDTTQK